MLRSILSLTQKHIQKSLKGQLTVRLPHKELQLSKGDTENRTMENNKKHSPYCTNLALSILTAKDGKPIGLVIPLTDWEKLKPSLQPESPLYKLMESLAAELANTSPNVAENDDENEKQDSAEEVFIRYKNEL